MNTTRSHYQVHARLVVVGNASADFDEIKAGHPLERRLNRMERVAAAYRGRIDNRLASGLQIFFETADAALLGACEMQHRCAELPQVSGKKLALRIGIHAGVIRQRSQDDHDPEWESASQLAVVDDGVVVSGAVVSALNAELHKLAQPLNGLAADLAAHQVDWHCEIPAAAYGGESIWPAGVDFHQAGPHLVLHYGVKTLEVTPEHPVLTVGRDPLHDLVIITDHVSRNHCRIERRADSIVLTDSSTNGTAVMPDGGEELMVRNGAVVLRGKGLLFFGRQCHGERRGGVRYEAH